MTDHEAEARKVAEKVADELAAALLAPCDGHLAVPILLAYAERVREPLEVQASKQAAGIERLRAQLAEAVEGKREAERRAEQLQQDQYRCWTCGGDEDPACACGGTGSHADEVQYMRERCLGLDSKLLAAEEQARSARAEVRQRVSECCGLVEEPDAVPADEPRCFSCQRSLAILSRPEAHTPEPKR